MNNIIKNLPKKNIVFSIIMILFIISLLITNTIYTNYSNQLITDWFIDSTTKDVSSYFQCIKNIEQDLNKTSYNLFNKDINFLSYVSGFDRSATASQHVDTTLRETSDDKYINEIYIYNEQEDAFKASFFKDGYYSDQNQLKKIISEYSPSKRWFFSEAQNATNGTLYYITEDFSGFYAIFSVSPQTINSKFSTLTTKNLIKDFTFFYDNEYLFDSSTLKTGQFNKIVPDHFNFGSSTHYKDKTSMYIKTPDHGYTIVTTHDLSSFSSWKLNATKQLTNVLIIMICIYLIIFFVSYIISRRKVFSFNNALSENDNTTTLAIKNTYNNVDLDENTINEIISHYFEYTSFQYLIFQLDKMHSPKSERLSPSDILKILYMDILTAFKVSNYTTATITDNDTIIVFLASKNDISYNTICEQISKLRHSFYKETKYTVSAVAGHVFTSPDDICYNIQKICRLKQFRFLYGYNSFIYGDMIEVVTDVKYPSDLEAELINAIILSEHDHSLTCMDAFIDKIIKTNNPSLAREWIATLSFSILKNTRYLYDNSDDDFNHLKRIFECETLSECIPDIQKMLPNIDLINKNTTTSIGHFRHYVLEFLENNYTNPNINIAYIAERMDMSPTYWGQKFIKEFSIPFNTYLSDFRINKSLKYLKGTNEKISDIAVKCGFSNSSYFTKAFRERYNITPSQFRNTQFPEDINNNISTK